MKTVILSLAIAFAGVQAQASCLEHYRAISNESLADSCASEKACGPVATTLGGVPLFISSVSDSIKNSKSTKMANLIQDQRNGAGLVLAEFAQKTNLTRQQAIVFVKEMDDKNVFCSDKNNVYSFDDAVKLGIAFSPSEK